MTMRRARSAVAFALVVASLTALTAAFASQTLELSAKDDGKTFALLAGDRLIVSLKSNPSTGYTWRIAQDDRQHLQPLGQVYNRPKDAMPGAPGRQVFRFQAGSPGTTTLELDYARQWEKNVPPAETFSITVTIR
jgi:inhibitor of cysteine peptidase